MAANRSKSQRRKPQRRKPARTGAAVPSDGMADHPDIDPRHLEPVNVDAIRRQIANLVGNRALEVVQQVLDQTGRGNYQAMKYLFEIAGLFPLTVTEETSGEDSLTKTLLNYLGDAAQRGPEQNDEADTVK